MALPLEGATQAPEIAEKESTVIVGEDAIVSTDEYGFLWIELSGHGP